MGWTPSWVIPPEEVAVPYWEIDEQAAGQVMLSAAGSAKEYPAAEKSAEANKSLLLGALANSEFVAAAVEGWMANCGSLGISCVKGMTGIAVQATGAAITAYHKGDLGMATNAQNMANSAEYPGEMPKADKSSNPAPAKKK